MIIDFLKEIYNSISLTCYFRTKWGIYCPGCGGTRALFAILNGEILASVRYNPITLLFLIDLIFVPITYLIEKSNKELSLAKIRLMYNLSLLIFIFVYFIARNLLLIYFGIDLLGDFN